MQPISSHNAINFTSKESHCSCSDKLQILLDKVDKLERSLLMFRNQGPQRSSNLTTMKCYNCNGLDIWLEIAKNDLFADTCGLAGHISENCCKKRRPKLRNFVPDNTSHISEPSTARIVNKGEDIEEVDCVEYNQSSPVYGIAKQITNSTKKSVSYPRCIENCREFIDGNGNRPKKTIKKNRNSSRLQKSFKIGIYMHIVIQFRASQA